MRSDFSSKIDNINELRLAKIVLLVGLLLFISARGWGQPTATISSDVTICQNAMEPLITFTGADGTAPYTFTYNINGVGDLTITTISGNSITVSVPTGVSGTFVYTLISVSDANLGPQTASGSATVTVNPLPTATIIASGATTFCEGGSVTLTSSTGSSYLWSTGATTSSINVNTSGDYSVQVTDGNGCQATSSSTAVTVNPLPTATITPGGPTSFCEGGSVTLTSSTGSSYLWSTGATISSINVTITGNYSVQVIDGNGCQATSSSTAVTVNPLPTVNVGSALIAICQGGTSSALGGSIGGSATGGTWSTPEGGTFNPNATTLNATWTPPGGYSGTTTLTLTTSGGSCGTTAASKTQVVNPLPTVSPIGGGAASVCVGSTTPAFTDATAGGTWSIVPVTGTASITVGGVVTGLTAGTVTVTYTVTNGCGTVAATQSLTINALPTVSPIGGGAASVCVGSTTPAFIDATGGGIWSIVPGTGTASITGGGVVTGLTVGTVIVTYTVTNSCSSIAATQSLTINDSPTANAGSALSPICQGTTSVALGGSVGGSATGGTWSTPAGGTFTPNATTLNAIWTPPGGYSGTATLTLITSGGSCGTASASKTQVVNPLPTVSPIGGGAASVCVGSTTPAFTDATAGGTWSIVPVTGTASITVGGVVTGLTAGTVTVAYTFTNGCGSVSATYSLIINALPTANAGSALSPICQGATSAALGGSVGGSATGGTWSTPAGGTFTPNSTTLNATWTPPGGYSGTATLTLITSGGSCGTASASKTQVVNPLPTISPLGGGAASVCVGSTTPAFTDATAGGTWSIVQITGTASITVGGVVTGLTAGTVTVTYTVTNGCGTVAATQSLTINALPMVSPIGGGAASVCVGSTTPAFTDATGGGIWSIDPGTGTASITFGGAVTGLTAGTVTVTYTVTNGCGPIAATLSLTINALPSAPTIGTIIQPTCAVVTGSVILNGLPAGNWTINPRAIAGSTPSVTISGLATGTYNFTVTSAGCISSPTINVVINAQPPTPVVPNQTAAILSGGTFNVTPVGGTIPLGTTYTWTAPSYTGNVTGGSAQPIPQTTISGSLTNPSGIGTARYIVTPVSGICIGATFTLTVTVTSTCVPVTIVNQPTTTSMCATSGSASFTLVANGTGPFSYQWQYNNGGTWNAVVNGTPAGASYTNSTTPTLNVSGITSAGSPQYRCFITNCEGGNNTTSNIVTLTVNASPIPTLTSSDADNIFCQGTTVTFTAGGGTNFNFRVGGVTRQSGPSTTFPINYLTNGQIVDVIVTNSGCSATSAQIQNIVNPLPLIIVTSSAACSPSWLTYSIGVTVSPGGVVTCTEPLATITNTSGDIWAITDIPAGTTVDVIVTVINGCTNSIHVLAPDCNCPVVPAPVSGGDKSYCAGGVIPALTMTVTTGKTADWYNSSSGGTPVLSGSLSYTPSIAGTYYALAREISSGCVSSTRTAVTLAMNPLPITSLTSSDIDNVFCAGTSIIFTATGGTNYNFLVAGVSEQDGASANYTTNALTNGQVVIVMVTNADGCSEISAPLTNTVNPAPAPTLTSSDADSIFCAGTSVTFTAGGGTMYDFRIDGVTVQSGASPTYITSLLTNGQIVNVVVSNANCSATSSNIVNSVNLVPIPELVSSDADNTFCAGTSVTFTAGGGTNFDFRVGGISVQNGTLSAYTTTSLTNGQVVDVIVANSTGCSVTSTGIFNTVNPQPVTNAGTGGTVCDLKFRLNAIPSTGIGTWTKTTGPGTATFDPNPNTPNATVTVSEYGTYTFTWTEVSGPCSGSSTITVNFYQQPVAVVGTGGNNCGLGFHFNASLNVGTGTWVKVSGPGNASFSPDANTANALVTVTAYGIYNFSWTAVNGTCSDTANINVVFIEQLPADAGSGGSECDKDFILNANVTTTGTGTWTKASGPGNAVFTPDNHQPDAKVTVDQSGSYDFAWTVVNSNCTSTDIVSVLFHDLPVINAGRDTAVCKGSSVPLQATGTGSFSWVPVELLSNPDIMNPVATPDTTTTFEVSLIDQFGCKNKDSIVVEVREMLLADAGPDQELGYLFFTNMDGALAHNYESGVWTVISGTGEFADTTSAKTRVEGLSPGPNVFLWTVSNGFCPLSMDSVNIVVYGFVIPTLITPNMDGRNDYFVLKGITTLGKTELSIFDRRGARVYSNLDYDNSWNGVDYNENALPDDTYFYVLKTENGKSLSGYIVIRR